MYRIGADSMGLAAGGALAVTVDTTGVTIAGNLTVQGTTTTVETANVTIEDNIIEINKGETGAAITAGSAGIEVDRGTGTNAQIVYNDTTDRWEAGLVGGLLPLLSGFTDVGAGAAVVKQVNGSNLEVKTIVGGDGLTATSNTDDVTLALDINGMTAETTFDQAADKLVMYDASASANRTITWDEMANDITIPLGSI